jgi:hypothetical protein
MKKGDFVQFFETTVFAGDDRTAFRFMSFPVEELSESTKSLFHESSAQIWHPDTYPLLDESVPGGLIWSDRDPGHEIKGQMWLLPYIVAALGGYSSGDDALNYIESVKFKGMREAPNGDTALLNVASELVDWPVIPTKQSPLLENSLKDIILKGSGVSIGATVGFLVGWGSPLLFVTVPAGMFICGSAAGLAKACEKGLYKKALAWMGVEE